MAVSHAIEKVKRPMIFSLSPGPSAYRGDADLIADAVSMCVSIPNIVYFLRYRITDDVWDVWSTIDIHFEVLPLFEHLIGVGGSFPDSDMLPLGYLSVRGGHGVPRYCNLTEDEQRYDDQMVSLMSRSLISLWAITKSPLVWGGDPTKLDNFTLSLLTNEKLLALDHFSENNHHVNVDSSQGVFHAIMYHIHYVGLFNRMDNVRYVN